MLSVSETNVGNPSVADARQACEKNSSSKGDSAHSMRFLPEGYEPGPHDVLCGRGRKCFNHPGNVKFRDIVLGYLPQYSKSMTKLEKSYILSDVVEKVRKHSGIGGFVKKDEDGRWYEVGDFLAREKTSQAFRDVLHDKYKSSNTSKKKRRQEEQAEKLFKGHSCRSLDAGSVHTAGSETTFDFSTGHDSSKLMRLERSELIGINVEESQDDILGALDRDLANSFRPNAFGGRKGLASQRSQRSVVDFDKRRAMLSQAKSSPSWYNHSCPNLFKNGAPKPPTPTPSMDHPPIPTQVVLEDSVLEDDVLEPTPIDHHLDLQKDTIDRSYGSQGREMSAGRQPPRYRDEWMHHSQPNLFANIHNPAVASRRRQFARMPTRRQGSARDLLGRQGSARNLMVGQGSGRNLMSMQGSARNLMGMQGSGRDIMLHGVQHMDNLSNGSHAHTPMNNHSSASNHSRHSMTVFEEQLDNLALSDRAVPRHVPSRQEEPDDIDINDLILSPMAGETKDTLLASLASLSDSFAIEPIEENPYEPVPLR